jgi:hypothetical protein
MSHPCGTKTQGGDGFSRNRPFRPRAIPWRLADQRPLLKNYLCRVGLVLKISARSLHSVKNYSTFLYTQTHRQTDLQSIYRWLKMLCHFGTFHFTIFGSITPSIKNNSILYCLNLSAVLKNTFLFTETKVLL